MSRIPAPMSRQTFVRTVALTGHGLHHRQFDRLGPGSNRQRNRR